jgi:hypothetical protein
MTEAEWRACTDPTPMLAALRASGKVSARKSRLLWPLAARGAGPFREAEGYVTSERVADVIEQYADGRATWEDVVEAGEEADPALRGGENAELGSDALLAEFAEFIRPRFRQGVRGSQLSALLRDLFGPLLFRGVRPDPAWLAWNAGTVTRLAAAAYEERSLPEGTLDADRLAVLADALEEAGCGDPEILGHLRERGGAHVRGCWVLDLLLGRE